MLLVNHIIYFTFFCDNKRRNRNNRPLCFIPVLLKCVNYSEILLKYIFVIVVKFDDEAILNFFKNRFILSYV